MSRWKSILIAVTPALAVLSNVPEVRAQEPVAGADTVSRDSIPVRELPEITVTRAPDPLERVPYAVGVLDRTELQRGQQTLGIDEALNNLPGVVVSNRYNFSLDQRISIRGFGSRSNFGVRGLKILLDGVPRTLPDGQSQLTNVDFADIERAEVLRFKQPAGLYRGRGAAASAMAMNSTSGRAGPQAGRAVSAAPSRYPSSRPMASASTARPSFASSTAASIMPSPDPPWPPFG